MLFARVRRLSCRRSRVGRLVAGWGGAVLVAAIAAGAGRAPAQQPQGAPPPYVVPYKVPYVVPTAFKVTDLGELPGGRRSEATGINDAGEIVGCASVAGERAVHAFKWMRNEDDEKGKMRDLGVLSIALGAGAPPDAAARASSRATAINEAGQVVGRASTASGEQHAFLWVPTPTKDDPGAGRMADLGALPGDPVSQATAINDAGEIVGWSSNEFSTKRRRAWICAGENEPLRPLGVPDTNMWCQATGISGAGLVVGESFPFDGRVPFQRQAGVSTFPGDMVLPVTRQGTSLLVRGGRAVADEARTGAIIAPHGFLWRPDANASDTNKERAPGISVSLGTLGGSYSGPAAISDNGLIVGSARPGPGPQTLAFVQSASGEPMRALPTLGGDYARALGVNRHGQVVGWSLNADGNRRAFLWNGETLTDLNKVMDVEARNTTSGWVLWEARGINARGEIVGVGYLRTGITPNPGGRGVRFGRAHAFLLTPVLGLLRYPK